MRRVLLTGVLALACTSCAFMNRRNRPLMNWCEKHLVPEGVAAQVATAPVVLPVCLAAGIMDTVVAHPITVIDDAWFHTEAALWEPTDRGYVTECALLPARAALTPPVWALLFSSRVVFDVPPWPPSPEKLETRLLSKDREVRMWAVEALTRRSYNDEVVEPATTAMLKGCRAHAEDAAFCEALILRLPEPLTDAAREYLGELARMGRGRRCAAAITRLFMGCLYQPRPGKGEAGRVRRAQQALNHLTQVYDDLVKAGHHEAEVYMVMLAASRVGRPAPRALGLYAARSLARRGSPDYAERAAFLLQAQLLRYTEAARIDAVDYEWRVLRVKQHWPREVSRAIRRQGSGQGAGERRAALIRQQNEIASRLQGVRPGQAEELLQLTEWLMDIKTLLDAEEIAERLLTGPEADLKLFMGDPFELLRAKDEP